jgi:hypothetical protein
MPSINIPHNYIPRLYQENLYNCLSEGIKRGVAVWHRRAKILWDGMDRDGFPFLNHIPEEVRDGKPNSTEMKLRTKNGSLFQVVGSDNINTIVGTNPVGCVFSEYALQDPAGWDFISPILLENDGWALFNFTPRGFNHGWRLFDMAQGNPEWFSELLTIDDTKRPDGDPVISRAKIDSERASGKTEDFLQQEYWCSFEASIPGAYFANEMRMAREQDRICDVPVDSVLSANTYWDIGSGLRDAMTVWVAQTAPQSVKVVAYHMEYTKPFLYFVSWLKEWKAKHGVSFNDHVLPHDGASPNPHTGKTSEAFLQELVNEHLGGKVKCAKKPNRKEDGIESVRQFIPKCYFDRKSCDRGIESLVQYHKEWDSRREIYKHVHDWTSHGVDGFQTMALAHEFKTNDVIFRPNRKKNINKYAKWRNKRMVS